MAGIEAGTHLENPPETAQQQTGARQQDNRERYFRHDKNPRKPRVASAGAGAAATFSEIFNLAGIGGLQRGSEAEEDAGD